MTKYIPNETVTDIDQIIHKICMLLAYLQIPAVIAVAHYSQDIGNLERWVRPPLVRHSFMAVLFN